MAATLTSTRSSLRASPRTTSSVTSVGTFDAFFGHDDCLAPVALACALRRELSDGLYVKAWIASKVLAENP